MGRVVYVVAREHPLLCGYLMARVGGGSSGRHLVEIKLDERHGERRLSSEARAPERRRGERRLQPSLESDLRSQGYAKVVQPEAGRSWTDEPGREEPAMAWRPRSTWGRRAARAGWRSRVRWGLIVVLLVAVGGSIVVVAQSIDWAPDPTPPAPQIAEAPPPPAPRIAEAPRPPAPRTAEAPPVPAPRTTEAAPPPLASKAEPVVPAARPLPPASPSPARVVSTRFSGVVLSVDPRASALVLEDGRRRVAVAPDARVVLSERDEQPEDLSHPFKDTVIGLSDVRRGDYVVVEMRGPEGKELARSVVVTFRPD